MAHPKHQEKNSVHRRWAGLFGKAHGKGTDPPDSRERLRDPSEEGLSCGGIILKLSKYFRLVKCVV